jgi:DNA-binding NarL/FixJ family response regulator
MRIMIVDDHAIMRRGMVYVVEQRFPDANVVEAGSASAALDAMREQVVDVVLVDIRMPDMDGLDLLRAIRGEWPDAPVIMLSTHEYAPDLKRALSDGAAGYLLKDATLEDLGQAIDAAISGGSSVLSQRAIQSLFEDVASSSGRVTSIARSRVTGYHLTQREHEILALLSEGRSNRSIAQNLYVSEETVKGHLNAIFRKLGVTNRTQAAMMAVELGVERSPGWATRRSGGERGDG